MSNIKINKRLILSAILSASLSTGFLAGYNPAEAAYRAPSIDYLQTKDDGTVLGDYYVPSTLDNVFWGKIPSRNDKAIIHIPSGSTVTIDTVSHEGILEDQGKDPIKYFGQYGITPDHVMQDAINIAANKKGHDFDTNGPHVITGPIYVDGAEPGDVLKVEVIALEPRVPYGVVTNRHFKGTIPDEMPETPRLENPSSEHPESYGNVSVFTSIQKKGDNNEWFGIMQNNGQIIQFPLNPFLGTMGVTPNTDENGSSIPPLKTGGNIDINELGVGATLYLPVDIPGAGFYTGDPHFAQGDGEVSLTALEAPLRATVRLTVLKKGSSAIPQTNSDSLVQPFAETEKYWIPIGLNEDLDEAMRQSVRESISFISKQLGVDRKTAYAYLSAATDYEVSQVVDKTKGIHGLIPKVDFKDNLSFKLTINNIECPIKIINNVLYVPIDSVSSALKASLITNKDTTTLKFKDNTFSTKINSNVYEMNGISTCTNSAPTLSSEGTIFIPVSTLSEIMGLPVNWSTTGHTIIGISNYLN